MTKQAEHIKNTMIETLSQLNPQDMVLLLH